MFVLYIDPEAVIQQSHRDLSNKTLLEIQELLKLYSTITPLVAHESVLGLRDDSKSIPTKLAEFI
jgi:hypothetical protein